MRSSPKPERVQLPTFAQMMADNGLDPELPGGPAGEGGLPEEALPPLGDGEPSEAAEPEPPEAGEAPEGGLSPEEAEIARTEELCSSMRREAMKEAASIVAQAREEATAIVGKARRDMDQEIEKRTAEKLRDITDGAAAAAKALSEARDALCSALEPQFLNTAILIAESILTYELERSGSAYTGIVRNVLERTYMAHDVELHLPPGQYDRLVEAEGSPFRDELARQGVQVVRDMALAETDCLVKSDMGSIRGGVSTQLARIRYAASNQQIEVQAE